MKARIETIVEEFVLSYKRINNTSTSWTKPLVAFASAEDPLFVSLKKIVSETHATPKELLSDSKTVISYFIPIAKEVVFSNVGRKISSADWVLSYIETNKLIIGLNDFLLRELKKSGYSTFVLPPTHNFDEKKLISDWSHRHVAYIAGLGKFGRHNLLITEKGCCGRVGSIITGAEIDPTKRAENENCIYKNGGECSKCIDNCIFGALTEESFDRHKCYEICLENARAYKGLGFADVCGKCCSVVPCSFTNPSKKNK